MKKIKLDQLKKVKVPYEVPEDYFELLEKRIQEKVTEPTTSPALPGIRWALIPAFLVVLTIGFWVVSNQFQKSTSTDLLAEVSDTEILAYLESTELSLDEIASLSNDPGTILDEMSDLDQLELDDAELDQLFEEYELDDEFLQNI